METSEMFGRVVAVALAVVLILAAVGLVSLLPYSRVSAQTAGTVGLYTQELQIFSARAAAASSGGTWQCLNSPTPIACPYFPDHGYGVSILTYCNTSFAGTIDLDWTPPGTTTPLVLTQANYSTISPDSNCHTLQIGGYYPQMRATMTRTVGSLSAWYTAMSGPVSTWPPALGSNGPTSPVSCDQEIVIQIATGLTSLIAQPNFLGDTLVLCGFTVSFTAAPSGSAQLQLAWATSNTCGTLGTPTWISQTSANTPLYFAVPLAQRSSQAAANPYPCLFNGSGTTVAVSFSYASVHGL